MANPEESRTATKVEAIVNSLNEIRLSEQLQSAVLRASFLKSIFGQQPVLFAFDNYQDSDLAAFFARYARLCSLAANINRAIENLTHGQLVAVISLLRDPDKRRWPRWHLIEEIRLPYLVDLPLLGEKFAEILLDLAVNVWSMLSIGRFPGDISYDEPIFWNDIESLSDVVNKCFPSRYESQDLVKLPQTFTAAHLEKIGGIQVVWTSNLADHLLLRDDDTKLMLFHQVSVLKMHMWQQSSLFPEGLVEETVRTISLLVPPVLGEPNPWFRQQQRTYKIDTQAGSCNRLNSTQRQIKNFMFWRDRLVLLKRTFDDTEPRSISQLWWDDRKKTQWFTFWVAVLVFILTLFFGVVQSVAGIVQAWASVRSLQQSSSS